MTALERMHAKRFDAQQWATLLLRYTADEIREMEARGLSPAQFDMSQLRCAHGSLVASVLHLSAAAKYFARVGKEDVFNVIEKAANDLAPIIPDYLHFDAATKTPRSAARR